MKAPSAGACMVALALFAAAQACEGSGVYVNYASFAGDAEAPDAPQGRDAGLCQDGQSVDGVYPNRPTAIALHATLPDLTFDALDAAGAATQLSLHQYFEPCAAASRLLVLRTGAAWCGTCRWHYAHTGALKALDVGPRLLFFDLEIANVDGFSPQPFDVARLAKLIDAPDRVGADPKFQLGKVNPSSAPLPLYVFVDTRTMTVQDLATNPDPTELELRIHQAFATLDGTPQPVATVPAKLDGVFFQNEWDLLHDMTLPGAPPPDTTNAKSDDPAAAALGKRLFSDASLSPSGTVSCATCHVPTKLFQDGLPVSEGLDHTDRNAPSLATASHQRWQFWDGRADTLWMQALGPIENKKEFGSSRLFVAHRMFDAYAADYQAIWGTLPPLGDTARFPAAGQPGDRPYDLMAAPDKTLVTRVFVNVAKTIAAYERTLRIQPNRFDAYVGGNAAALTGPEKNGLSVFFALGCAQCHWGPRLTDDAFHATRFPTGRQDGFADVGRQEGQALLIQSPFLSGGPYSDDRNTAHALGIGIDPAVVGAFKTPTLRGITGSAPFGHGGKLLTLDDVVTLYSQGGLPANDPHAAGVAPPWLVTYDHNAKDALLPFLMTLDGNVTP
jgi:cytochrome c peroxidase